MQYVCTSTKNYQACENARKEQSEETKKASELVSDMKQMLELSDKHLTMINMLRALMEK